MWQIRYKALYRPKEITENMQLALQFKLQQYPGMSQQALSNFLHKGYGVRFSRSTIGRTMERFKWSKKVMDTVAKEQNQDLRDDYIWRRSLFRVEQMVFIDESGDDRRIGIPKRGYAPKGVTPKQTKRFHRGRRVFFLPAYTIDGITYCEVYEGHTDTNVVEAFLLRLLLYLGRYPEPLSVVFMDNASFHNISLRVREVYAEAGALIQLQSPHSPDLNPIEYFFGSLKTHIGSRSLEDEDLTVMCKTAFRISNT